jgi:hypothetical protein
VNTSTAVPLGETLPWSYTDAGAERRQFLAIVCAFWCYATLSAVLYTYALDANLYHTNGASIFAPWQSRVLQYAMLLPALLACYALSLRLGWQPFWRRLPMQLGLAAAFALLARPAMWVALWLSGTADEPTVADEMHRTDWLGPEILVWVASFTDFLVRYGFGLALVTGFTLYKRSRDAELRAEAIGRERDSARLAALRMQLSPHTLFNLLHTIRGHITWDPPAAQRMVVQLADLLRRLLNASEQEFSPLRDEIHFAGLYLDLQRQRFADRLTIELPDAETVPRAWIPTLILQPLVENAVSHGLDGHSDPVTVRLECEVDGERLRLTVTNDTTEAVSCASEGVGLRNVRQRLAVTFAGNASLWSGRRGDGRWQATIDLPRLLDSPRDTWACAYSER